MPADRLLNTVLQLYRNVHDDHKTNQIVGSTTNLLTTLSNPLNLGVLTSQLLTAPAIWHRRDGLQTSVRIMSVYNSAAVRVREIDIENAKNRANGATTRQGGGIHVEEWTKAVAKGADDRSSRWRHLLVLTGILMGMEGDQRRSLSGSLRNTLEQAVVTAANLSLEHPALEEEGSLAGASVVLALNYAFPLLSDFHRGLINCDALLPLVIQGITDENGFEKGNFLAAVNIDVKEVGPMLHWAPATPSFQRLPALGAKPLMGGIGPLSRLAAFAAERAKDSSVPFGALNALLEFTSHVLNQWQANRLSAIDQSQELMVLTPDARQATTPAMWEILGKIMFTTVTILQAIVARSLLDPGLRNDAVAPQVADLTLRTLRNLFFVSSRNGNDAFQAYSFVYLTSIDILARYPDACVALLSSLKPANPNAGARHPVDRALDLFYLNVSEHLPLNMPTQACDDLIVQPATAYLTPQSQQQLLSSSLSLTTELFEAAHSAILSTLACPHNGALTTTLIPFYIDALFASFPSHISPRQFRIAFKTVMQIVSPPFPIAATDPHLSETLLEMLRFKALGAGTAPLPPAPDGAAASSQEEEAEEQGPPLSEQSSLVLTLVDALPSLPLPLVEEWLAVTARTMNEIRDPGMKGPVRDRFLEVLVSGEMDVERAAIGVAWWGTKGGQELVLGTPEAADAMQQQVPVMSGALQPVEEEGKRQESKL